MNFDRIENDTRRAELIRVLEHSIEQLSLAELEALYYDLVAKDYIKGVAKCSCWITGTRRFYALPSPLLISNVTVPLLGLIDLAVVGHIGNEAYISAIAVGSMIFNVMYWLLGFLRMGTSGMTSQAYGRQDGQECMNILVRTLTIGVGMGVHMLVMSCHSFPYVGILIASTSH